MITRWFRPRAVNYSSTYGARWLYQLRHHIGNWTDVLKQIRKLRQELKGEGFTVNRQNREP